ncbi:MAG: dUTP diphosphatase [Hydrogenophaga sp.]|nr:dUTP diphosphatase [Hydrogenophaga sp.]
MSNITTSDGIYNAPATDTANPSGIPAAKPEVKRADGKSKGARKVDENKDGITDGLKMKIALVLPGAKQPTYATDGSGFFDIYSPVSVHLNAGQAVTIDTGVKFEVPAGWTMLAVGRSGHGINNDVRLANCAGVIDSDFRGTAKVKLRSDGITHLMINAGDRIAQAALVPTPRVAFEVVDESELSDTERGEGGLGSTGA